MATTITEKFYATVERTRKNTNARVQYQGFTLCAQYARHPESAFLNKEQVALQCERDAAAAYTKWMEQ